jgi:hypothetical protein
MINKSESISARISGTTRETPEAGKRVFGKCVPISGGGNEAVTIVDCIYDQQNYSND